MTFYKKIQLRAKCTSTALSLCLSSFFLEMFFLGHSIGFSRTVTESRHHFEKHQLSCYSRQLRSIIGLSSSAPSKKKSGYVAVIDSGFNKNHWYLKKNIYTYTVFKKTGADLAAFDGIQSHLKWQDQKTYIDKSMGHGTSVAGVIKHILPSVSLKLFNVSSFKEFSKAVDLIKLDPSVRVVNISKGYSRHLQCHKDILKLASAGKIVVCSAGNEQDKNVNPKIVASLVHHPMAKGRILLVGAAKGKSSDEICSFSVRANGSGKFYILAPGYQILTSATNEKTGYNASVNRVSGTSFSAPIVSGCLMALLNENSWSIDRALSFLKENGLALMPKQIKKIDPIYGCGKLRLNQNMNL